MNERGSKRLHPDYLGIKSKVSPSALSELENMGFVLEEKYDGWWCVITVDGSGARAETRYGNDIPKLRGLSLPPLQVTLVGEYMPDSGVVWVHDIIRDAKGKSTKGLPLWERRDILETVFSNFDSPIIRLVPQFHQGFSYLFNAIVDSGGEGVVLKHEDSFYGSRLKSQKTAFWLKCKPIGNLPRQREENENTDKQTISSFDSSNSYLVIDGHLRQRQGSRGG